MAQGKSLSCHVFFLCISSFYLWFPLDSHGSDRYIFLKLVSNSVNGCQMNFSGEYNVSIDSKGRVSVPAQFRDELRDKYQTDSLIVTRQDKGLVAYPPSRWAEIEANVLAMPRGKLKDAYLRNRVSPAKECPFNAQGRVQVPQSLREYAGLDKIAVVVGMDEKIEIWNQQTHADIVAESEDLLAEDAQGQADLGF